MTRTRLSSRPPPAAAAHENDTYPLFPVHRRCRKEDDIGRCIDMLHEKRRAVREAGLQGLVGILKRGLDPIESIESRCVTLLDRCRASLNNKAASTKEARLAFRAIGLLALTVGGASDACSGEILRVALRGLTGAVAAATSTSSSEAVAAIDCLAAVTFACARWPWEADPAMGAIHGVINKLAGTTATGSSDVLISAVSAWALLAATVAYTPSSSMTPWRGLTELLDSDDPAVLMTAAEALAVCTERNLTEIASSSSAEDVHALETKVSILAAQERGRGVDKKTHAKQTRMFAQIDDMMKHGVRGRPRKAMLRTSTTSTSGGCLLEAPKWARRAQLKFLTRFLGDGFGTHSRLNPLIHEDSDSDDDESGSDDCESGSDDGGGESESDDDGSDSGSDDCESGSDDHGDPDSCSAAAAAAAAYEEFLLTGFFLDGTAGADEEFVMVDHDENEEEFVMV